MRDNDRLFNEEFTRSSEYWQGKFSGQIERIGLPIDFERTSEYEACNHQLSPGDQLTSKLLSLSKDKDILLFVVLMAGLKALVFKYTGKCDISIAAPVYTGTGSYSGGNSLIIFRDLLDGEMTFKELLVAVKQTVIEGYENQHYVIENTPDILGVNPIEAMLTRVILMMESLHSKEIIMDLINSPANDMALSIGKSPRGLTIDIQFNGKLFKKDTIKRISSHYQLLLEQVLEDMNLRLKAIDLLTEEARKQLLFDFNNTDTAYPGDKGIHRLFEQQVQRTPSHTAVICEDRQIPYDRLNRQANQLARVLRSRGVKKDSIVGLLMESSPWMLVGILAVLKAGGAYLPMDPEYPEERITYMVRDSGLKLILSQERFAGMVKDIGSLLLIEKFDLNKEGETGENIDTEEGRAGNNAYIIYTSGTTGKPKAVLVRHKGIVNYTWWRLKAYNYTPADVTLQLLTYSFDGFGSNLYSGLLSGGSLVIIPPLKVVDFDYVAQTIRTRGVTNTSLVPGMYAALLDSAEPGDLKSLRFVVLAGEKTEPYLVQKSKKKNPGILIINEYGPTEASVTVAANIGITGENTAVIGTPIANTAIYILDPFQKLLPPGVTGELYIAGQGVAPGYLNNPELTRGKFDHDLWDYLDYQDGYHRSYRSHMSYISYTSYYKTGDLGRWLPEGKLQFVGRLDQQVKIRGYRVELKEIETRLSAHDEIKAAVVVAREKHNTYENKETRDRSEIYLCAYVVSAKELPLPRLRDYLTEVLPQYMVPSYFVHLEKLPLTPNGKVDLEALPVPQSAGISETYEAPRDEVEKKIQEIWAEILELEKDKIGINANFFNLGGHSLQATILATRVRKELSVKLPIGEVFEKPVIKKLAQYIREQKKERYTAVPPAGKQDGYRLSPAQRRLYILQQMDPAGTGYNSPQVIAINREIDKQSLEQTFKKLIKRHESLRTSFFILEGQPVQGVHEEVEFEIEYYDMPAESIIKNFIRPFDLSRAPLLRAALIKTGETGSLLIVDIHHIIADAISQRILVKDFTALDAGRPLPPLGIQYKDYSEWLYSPGVMETVQQQEGFWLKEFSSQAPVLNLPLDYPRPVTRSFAGSTLSFEIGREITAKLKQIAQEQGATLFMVLLAITNILFMKLSGQEDITIGIATAGRQHADLQHIIGMFVNTLALRNYPAQEKIFTGFLQEVKKQALAAFENQQYPFENLVDKVAVQRDASRNPLFDVMFTFQELEMEPDEIPTDRQFQYNQQTAKFDMTLSASEIGEKFSFILEYSTALFKKETVEMYMNYLKKIAAVVGTAKEIKISHIDIISREEKHQVLYQFNGASLDYSTEETLNEIFQRQVEKAPDNIAVWFENSGLTYNELNRKANRRARVLRQKGIGADSIVGLMVERSIEMIIGVIAILKAGGAYLPAAVDNPAARTGFMLEDSSVNLLLTQTYLARQHKDTFQLLPPVDIIPLDRETAYPGPGDDTNPGPINKSRDLAYVLYTSGTTGTPRSLMVEHRSVHNLVLGLKARVYDNYDGPLNVSLAAPYVFDASVQQVFAVLLQGHRLFIVPESVRIDGGLLIGFFQKNQIDISDGTPTHIRLLLDGFDYKTGPLNIKHLLIGGEALPANTVQAFFSKFAASAPVITNVYGPSECCVDNTSYQLTKDSSAAVDTIPIGKPMPNQQVYILNERQRLQPVGIAGELCIGGDGVGRGYLNNPELTAEKFCLRRPGGRRMAHGALRSALCALRASPRKNFLFEGTRGLAPLPDRKVPGKKDNMQSCNHAAMQSCSHETMQLAPHYPLQYPNTPLPHHPIYLTGDLARWRPDGNIEFLGRIDQQVKIRGFRIELEEIENKLLDFERRVDETVSLQTDITRCSRCLLSNAYPGINFDEDGTCNICRDYERYKVPADNYFKGLAQLDALILKAKQTKKSDYDCLLLYSGGKDSSYVLYRLVEMGLNVLAFTFDNGYISGTAFENIKRMTAKLGVDSIICNTANMAEIFVESLNNLHTVCSGCFKALTTISTRIAYEKGINMVVTGLSRGQIFDTKLHGFFDQGIFDTHEIEEKLLLFRKGYHSMEDKTTRLLNSTFDDSVWQQVYFVDYFRYDDIEVSKIKAYLKSKDVYWNQPGDTGFCSTNCMINDPGIYVHTKKIGYHNYEAPLSWDIRLGTARREEALKEVKLNIDIPKVREILTEIGYLGRQISQAVVVDRQDKDGDKYLCAYIVSDNEIPVPELREHLASQLPYYMIPPYFVRIGQIPLTPNGKVDRKALPEPEIKPLQEYAAPKTDAEKIVAGIWKQVLEVEKVGINDNFFDLGGNSLKIITLNRKLREEFKKEIPVVTMYRYSTISSFLQYLASEDNSLNEETGIDRTEKIDKAKERMKQRTRKRRAKQEESAHD
jgi:amino acid adenylation domain-containing protein